MISIELNSEQGRRATVRHIADMLCASKQHLNDNQRATFKKTLEAFATMIELSEIAARFDREWPTNLTWYDDGKTN